MRNRKKRIWTATVLIAVFLFLLLILSLGGSPWKELSTPKGDPGNAPAPSPARSSEDRGRGVDPELEAIRGRGMEEAARRQGGTLDPELARTGSERQMTGFQENLKYERYQLSDAYLVVKGDSTHLRTAPSTEAETAATLARYEKLIDPEPVRNADGSLWYQACRVELNDQGQETGKRTYGFVSSQVVWYRVFQYGKMMAALEHVEEQQERGIREGAGGLTYISNYKDYHGAAPQYQGTDQDASGNSRSQSAPGYSQLSDLTEFSYLEDGTLVRYLGESKGKDPSGNPADYVQVERVSDAKRFYVPRRYIPVRAALKSAEKAIVIDRTNQNEAVFEKNDGWSLISKTLATTGTQGTYHQPTPLGFFYVMEKREEFYYLKDGTEEVSGYAPWALRFAGGAYVHGVSTGYQIQDGKRKDPGEREYSVTVGTLPLSHKCVRNYSSHAKFLYDWYEPGKTLVIVIE